MSDSINTNLPASYDVPGTPTYLSLGALKMSLRKLVRSTPIIRPLFSPIIAASRGMKGRMNRGARHEQLRLFSNLRDLLVDDPVVEIIELQSKFALDVRSDLFRRVATTRSYEPGLFARCRELVPRNRDVIDVGANVGFYTVFLAKQLNGRRVVAVEPTLGALSRLRRNIDMNDVSERVTIFEGVASHDIGSVDIKTIEGREEYSSIGEMSHLAIQDEEYSVTSVASTTLDQLTEDLSLDPGFMKIDAEGSEHMVIAGARRVLTENRPIILVELVDRMLRENGSSFDDVTNTLRELDYQLVDPVDLKPIARNHEGHDILCLPR